MNRPARPDTATDMTIEDWLKAAIADAERRGLPELKPLLEGLAQSMTLLRSAGFGGSANDLPDPGEDFDH